MNENITETTAWEFATSYKAAWELAGIDTSISVDSEYNPDLNLIVDTKGFVSIRFCIKIETSKYYSAENKALKSTKFIAHAIQDTMDDVMSKLKALDLSEQEVTPEKNKVLVQYSLVDDNGIECKPLVPVIIVTLTKE